MTYVSLGQMRSALRMTDKIDDDLLTINIAAAEDLIDDYCGRSFGTATETRLYATTSPEIVQIDDLISVTSLQTSRSVDQVFDVTWATLDYQLEPLNGQIHGKPWPATSIRATRNYVFPATERASVRIEGVWGWATVPPAVVGATLLQAARLFKRFDSVLGIAGGPETGLIRVGRAIDGDVAQMLSGYRRGTESAGGIA